MQMTPLSADPGTGDSPLAPPQPRWRRWLRVAGPVLLGVPCAGFAAWAAAALWFDVPVAWLRAPLAGLFVLAMVAAGVASRGRLWRALATWVAGGVVVLAWWLTLHPSNARQWQPDVAVLPTAEIAGNRVTVHNVRNCDYRTETDFDVRHYDKTYDLDRLQSVDFFQVYWGSSLIAHTMVSFGFAGGDYLCISIETRKEKGEDYSALRGFFRQYELTYVIADERDLVRLRTNCRQGEEVYLYRTRLTPERARSLLLEYLRRANQLARQPEWYNALTSNCTTNIKLNSDAARRRRSPLDWRILANGRVDELLYENGAFVSPLPLAKLREAGHINARARAAGDAKDFSRQIRAGVPGIEP